MVLTLDERDEHQLVLLFDSALTRCPQLVTRGDDEVVVVSIADCQRLGGKRPGFIEHPRSMPSADGLDLTRDKSPMRDVDLGD
jgi:hypothetical protein